MAVSYKKLLHRMIEEDISNNFLLEGDNLHSLMI